MVASCWWFFCLIMVSSYTANLAAFLTVETITSPFDNVEELAKKKTIKYGAKKKGATLNFFGVSIISNYVCSDKFFKMFSKFIIFIMHIIQE